MFPVVLLIVFGLIYLACWMLPLHLSKRAASSRHAGRLRFLIALGCSVLAIVICVAGTVAVAALHLASPGAVGSSGLLGIFFSIWATRLGKKQASIAASP